MKVEEPTVPLLTYTLYHVTSRQAADDVLLNGFKGEEPIELSNSPWKIGAKGDTAIKVVMDLDEELVSGWPGDKHRFQYRPRVRPLAAPDPPTRRPSRCRARRGGAPRRS